MIIGAISIRSLIAVNTHDKPLSASSNLCGHGYRWHLSCSPQSSRQVNRSTATMPPSGPPAPPDVRASLPHLLDWIPARLLRLQAGSSRAAGGEAVHPGLFRLDQNFFATFFQPLDMDGFNSEGRARPGQNIGAYPPARLWR